MCFAIGWHLFKTIAVRSVFVKSFIDERHDRNPMRKVPVVLRQDVVANYFQQIASPPLVKKRIGGISCTRFSTSARVAASQKHCWPNVL